ncbi:MAG: hypothetical protein WDW38_005387 [Sanguina aurantia]
MQPCMQTLSATPTLRPTGKVHLPLSSPDADDYPGGVVSQRMTLTTAVPPSHDTACGHRRIQGLLDCRQSHTHQPTWVPCRKRNTLRP